MLFKRSATGCRPKTTVYSPDGTRSPPIAASAFAAASTPASSVKPSRRGPGGPPQPLAPPGPALAGTNALISADSALLTRGIGGDAVAPRALGDGASPPRNTPRRR